MKTLKCDLCEVTAQGETFEDWKEAIMPHYMEAHPDVIDLIFLTKRRNRKWIIGWLKIKQGSKLLNVH
jgi:hypothetical protein